MAAIESMTGARFVHDTLERCGWDVEVADAVKVKGLAPLACKTDRIDAWVLPRAVPPRPGPGDLAAHPRGACRQGAARFRLQLVRHRTALKNRVHATLLAFGRPCATSDLFGPAGRQLLGGLGCPSRAQAPPRRW